MVDNDAAVRAALESLLKAAGYGVESHASADDFLQSGRVPSTDCLLLDVRMPGMSGVELLEHLERIGAAIPIVLMTGEPETRVRRKSLSAKAVEFLDKPFSDDALIGAIERALGTASR